MIAIILGITLVMLTVIKLVNYGRWAGKNNNRRGAVGLYLLALFTLLIPSAVYVLNMLR